MLPSEIQAAAKIAVLFFNLACQVHQDPFIDSQED